MIKRLPLVTALMVAPLAPAVGAECKAVSGHMADRCGNLNDVPGALAHVLTATGTSMSVLTVQSPYGHYEFAERWPDQDRPTAVYIPLPPRSERERNSDSDPT